MEQRKVAKRPKESKFVSIFSDSRPDSDISFRDAAQGRAIIVISSELPEVMRLAHRIAVMCEGRLTGILPGGAETTQEHIMELATRRGSALTGAEEAI